MITKPILYKDERSLWQLRLPPDHVHQQWAPGMVSYGKTPYEVWIRFRSFEDARNYLAGNHPIYRAGMA